MVSNVMYIMYLWGVLQGAVISPSDEDSQTFSVSAANGEIYRLKGMCYYRYKKSVFRSQIEAVWNKLF